MDGISLSEDPVHTMPSDTARHEALDVLIAGLARRGLQAPACFLLDVARPFHLLIQQALLVAHPLLSPWAGDRLLLWADLLQDEGALQEVRRRLAL